MKPPQLGLSLMACVLLACAGPLSEAESKFKAGLYPEASEMLASMERSAAGWDVQSRAEYSLYRGLCFGALGDLPRARFWLREVLSIEAAWPRALSDADLRRLRVAAEAADALPE